MKARKAAGPATRSATGNSGKNSGVGNLKPFKPGQSGNLAGRPRGDARIRRLLNESLTLSEQEALAAFRRRWASTRYCQDMAELLARLEGELSKDAAAGARGVQVIILNNQGKYPLDPEVFREAARRRVLEDASGGGAGNLATRAARQKESL